MPLSTSRYYSNIIITDVKGNRYFGTWTSVDSVNLQSESDVFVKMDDQSRLDKLAQIYLGDSKYWWAIAMLNDLKHFWDWQINDLIRVPVSISKFMTYIKNNIDL